MQLLSVVLSYEKCKIIQMKDVYMCSPIFYDVIHEKLNIHMKMEKPVDKSKAMEQWTSLKELLQSLKIDVHQISPGSSLPDMVFAANGALLYKNIGIVSNFKAFPRRNEADHWNEYLMDKLFITKHIDTFFEGAGDALFSHDDTILWMGYGFRTDYISKYAIKNILPQVHIYALNLTNPIWYHLDTCFCPLTNNKLMMYPDAFSDESLQLIHSQYEETDIIKISKYDALNFACNAVNIGNHVIMHNASKDLQETLKKHGYLVHICPMDEFLLSGGSCKCCVLL